jgi:phosphoserine phosphatase
VLDEDLGMALTAMAAFDMDETPTDGLEELGEACQRQLQAYAAVERANGKDPTRD